MTTLLTQHVPARVTAPPLKAPQTTDNLVRLRRRLDPGAGGFHRFRERTE